MCPSGFSSYFALIFHHKSTKHGLKWKLASLSTSRAFEHLPKLHSFIVRWRRSSLLWPRKFSSFRYHNFWKFVIFDLHGQYAYQMKAGNILNANLTQKNTICVEKIAKKCFFKKKFLSFVEIFFSYRKFFENFPKQPPKFILSTCFKHPKWKLHEGLIPPASSWQHGKPSKSPRADSAPPPALLGLREGRNYYTIL